MPKRPRPVVRAHQTSGRCIASAPATPSLLVSILSVFVQGTPPNSLRDLWRTSGQSNRFCPRMTVPVRPWPPEIAKESVALGGPERFLSAVGQREALAPAARAKRATSEAPREGELRQPPCGFAVCHDPPSQIPARRDTPPPTWPLLEGIISVGRDDATRSDSMGYNLDN